MVRVVSCACKETTVHNAKLPVRKYCKQGLISVIWVALINQRHRIIDPELNKIAGQSGSSYIYTEKQVEGTALKLCRIFLTFSAKAVNNNAIGRSSGLRLILAPSRSPKRSVVCRSRMFPFGGLLQLRDSSGITPDSLLILAAAPQEPITAAKVGEIVHRRNSSTNVRWT